MKGFRDFILRGNVVDLAIGVVIGAAFAALTTAFSTAFLKPLIAIFVGERCNTTTDPTCKNIGAHFTVRGHDFLYGDFITAIITFLITAAVIYFFVVRPLNALLSRYQPPPEPAKPMKDCSECLSSIPAAATKCAFCSSKQPV